MAAAATACPTCDTAVPPGAARCPGCGRVFGEANRCPHCHAIAAARPSPSGYVCVACGKPRERAPGTTILGDVQATPPTPSARGPLVRAAERGASAGGALRALAAFLLLPAAAAAGAAFFVTSGLAIALGATAGALGAASWGLRRRAARADADAARERHARLEQATLALATERGGDLVATQLATSLGLGVAEADALLTGLADGVRVVVEVDADGVVHYVFRELQSAAPAIRVRVGADDADAPDAAALAAREAAEIADEARAQVERELASRRRV